MNKALKGLLLLGGLFFISTIAHAERNAFWQNLGPDGGSAYWIAVAPDNPDVIYIALANTNALLRSRDGGDSWEETTSIGPDRQIDVIIVDPINSAKLYVAFSPVGGEPVSGVLISSDGGTYWQQADIEDFTISNGSIPRVSAMVADPNHLGVVYMTDTSAEVYQTTDGGFNWFKLNQIPINNSNTGAQTLLLDPDSEILYAHWSAGGILPSKSTDNGRTWQELSDLPVTADETYVSALAIDPSAGNVSALYAIVSSSYELENPTRTLYYSMDGGLSWSIVNQNLPTLSVVQQLIVHPAAHQLLYASDGQDTYRSDDGGISWRALGNRSLQLALDNSDADKLYLASRRGVLRSNDRGNTWELANRGIPYSSIQQILIDPNTPGVIYTITDSGLFKSEDSGRSWRLLDNGLPAEINALVINPQDSRVLYADRFRSDDAGESWSEMNLALPRVHHLAIVANVPETLYAFGFTGTHVGAERAIFRSNDAGTHWQKALSDELPDQLIVDLEANPVNPDKLYLGVDDCSHSMPCGVYSLYESEDNGDHWRKLDVPWGRQLRIDPNNPQTFYFLNPNAVQLSTDSGENWQRFELDSPLRARSLTLDSNTQDTLYLGANIGEDEYVILRSHDGGRSQSALNNTNLPTYSSLMEFDRYSDALYIGSSGNGLYQVIPDYPVIWWDATRSGQGLSLWPRDDRLWGAWFLYDKNGEPIWLLFEGKPDNGLITAPLLQFKGPALGAAWNTSQVIGEEVGQINLDISNPQAPQLNATVNGVNPSIDLDLSAFRPQADGPLSGVWWDPEQSGQGIVLSQQGDDLWGVFHRYDESGDDIWVIFQGQFQSNILNAELLHFTGPTLGAAWNESLVLDSSVGQVTIKQQATDQLLFNYTLNGHSSVLNLVPF